MLVIARVTRPRHMIPGFYMNTRRCTQQQYLLRPDPVTNNAFLYCIGEAAQRFGIDLIAPATHLNHYHAPYLDRHVNACEFTGHFHRNLAKVLNARYGRWENFWASVAPSIVRLVEPRDVIRKIVYAVANPVLDGLVERVADWPGVNALYDLLEDRPVVAHRPKHFFSADGSMPEEVTIRYVLPPELGKPDEVRAEIRRQVTEVEERCAAARRRRGGSRPVLGADAVRATDPRAAPTKRGPRRRLSPRIACIDRERRLLALAIEKAFQHAYKVARKSWNDDKTVEFPHGTYWLHRFAKVRVAPAPEPALAPKK